MSMVGAPLSSIAPCPTIGAKKNERKRSFIRLPSAASSFRGDKLRPTKSLSYQNPGLPGMRFHSGALRSPNDAQKKKPEGSDNPNATILKAVPQADTSSSRDRARKSSVQLTESTRSPVRPRHVPILTAQSNEAPLQRTSTETSSGDDVRSLRPVNDPHPDFLGVWRDGTVLWAHEPERPASTDGSISTKKTDELDNASAVDVPVKLEQRPLRPKIHLTIPDSGGAQSFTCANQPASQERALSMNRPRSISPLFLDSAPSNSNNTTMRLHPKSFVPSKQADRPDVQRPFSMATSVPTIRGLGLEQSVMPAGWSSSSQSASSDDNADDDATSCYSKVSSASSVESEVEVKRPVSQSGSVAFSIVSPVTAGVFDDVPPVPRNPPASASPKSIADLSNKPLPPEPKEMAPAPLVVANGPRRASRTLSSSEPASPKVAKQRTGSMPVQPLTAVGKRKPSRSPKMALKSKYSTSELDALDKAFARSSPPGPRRPTLHEAEEALERQLSTISEHTSVRSSQVAPTIRSSQAAPQIPPLPEMNSPLQISRGPMDMAPSRAPPPTPPPTSSTLKAKPVQVNKAPSRTSLGHVATQMKSPTLAHIKSPTSSGLRSPPLIGPAPKRRDTNGSTTRWTAKAQKILGRSAGSDSPLSYLSTRSSQETLPTTPSLSNGDNSPKTPETPDPAVAEVHKRLEVLQLKQSMDSDDDELQLTPFACDFQLPIQAPSPDSRKTPLAQKPHIQIPRKEEGAAPPERRARLNSDYVPSLVSLAASDIPEMYASMPSSAKLADRDEDAEDAERTISADAAESVLLKILESLDNLRDLFSTAVVSRGFYRTFKRNELPLMKNALRQMSPAAWELREMSPPYEDPEEVDDEWPVPDYTPTSYLRYFTRDMYIMVALKSLILVRCESFLRPESVSALAGNDDERSLELDAAFWRVWTFCKVFGSGKGREDDIVGQMDWLRGGLVASQETCSSSLSVTGPSPGMSSALLNPPECFAKGNPGGLSPGELWDMMEIWTCLGTLIEGFQGKNEIAREYGVFDNVDVAEGNVAKENAMLEEWVAYLLSLGPSVIIDLATPSDQPGPSGFALAAENGWTDWEAPAEGGSRSTFLKEAVVRVYEEQVVGKSRSPSPASFASATSENARVYERQRIANHAAEIRARRRDPTFTLLPLSEERPMSNWQAALERFQVRSPAPREAPVTKPQQSSPNNKYKQPKLQQVHDPVDQAVWKMQGMGFSAEVAKKALADTDTGENLNLQGAIDLCLKWTGGVPSSSVTDVAAETHQSNSDDDLYS